MSKPVPEINQGKVQLTDLPQQDLSHSFETPATITSLPTPQS